MSDYYLGYYDSPIHYPDFRGKEDIARAELEGENDQAHLVPSTLDNTIIFSNGKAGKNNTIINSVAKTKKENNIL